MRILYRGVCNIFSKFPKLCNIFSKFPKLLRMKKKEKTAGSLTFNLGEISCKAHIKNMITQKDICIKTTIFFFLCFYSIQWKISLKSWNQETFHYTNTRVLYRVVIHTRSLNLDATFKIWYLILLGIVFVQ